MPTRRDFLVLTGAGLAGAALPAWAREMQTTGGSAFGSYWRLTHAGNLAASAGITEVIGEIDRMFSPYRPDSEISKFNASRDTDWQAIPAEFTRMVGLATQVAQSSGGAFDPTVGPIVARYGFGPIRGAMARYTAIEHAPGAIRKAEPDISIDFCAIAKGRALDLMCEAVVASGVDDFLLDLGGEVAVRGRNPAGRPWQVGVDVPGYPMEHAISLEGGAVATSGTLANGYRTVNGLISHIVDPRTGAPLQSHVRSVSVMADTAEVADAWATALLATPFERAMTLAESRGLDALLLMDDGGALRPFATGRMAEVMIG